MLVMLTEREKLNSATEHSVAHGQSRPHTHIQAILQFVLGTF